MSEQQEKVALSETQRSFLTPIVGGIAAGGVAYGLPAALDKVREVRVRRNRDKYITAMKDVHPDLKGIPKKDLHIAYNSMAMHSPHVLRDPLLGGQELLRMSKYRQADVNSLNEINKLRGNSMMDQAFMNATNIIAGGVGEGFKGYQAQRLADQDQAYREKMDQQRFQMDQERANLEKQKFQYAQTRDANRDAYQKTRDATLDSQFQSQQAYKKMRDSVSDAQFGQTRKDRLAESKLRQQQFSITRQDSLRRDRQNRKDRAADRQDRATARNQQARQRANELNINQQNADRQYTLSLNKDIRDRQKHEAWRNEGSPGPKAIKTASVGHIHDIVSRLRDRNL